jgi:hypothetical protein
VKRIDIQRARAIVGIEPSNVADRSSGVAPVGHSTSVAASFGVAGSTGVTAHAGTATIIAATKPAKTVIRLNVISHIEQTRTAIVAPEARKPLLTRLKR